MGVIRYDITEDNFAENKLPLCELSILVGMDSSSYLIVDDENQVNALRAIVHDKEDEWWKQDDRLKQTYRKTRLAWLSERFTIIPARLYDGNRRREYLSSLTNLKETDTVLADAIPELDIFLVYALDGAKLSEWRRTFIGCRFYHLLTPVLHQLAIHNRQQLGSTVYAYFRDDLLTVIALENGRLHFCNAFTCNAANDFLYFLLLAYEQCNWSPSTVGLHLFGELVEDAAIYKLFYRYFKKMSFSKLPAEAARNNKMTTERLDEHIFYDLFSLQLYH